MTSRILRKTSRRPKAAKPNKPYAEFPLTAHASGKWCKKVRGKIHYFGSWDDPTGAINEWLAVKDALLAGADPKQNEGQNDIGWLVNAFLDSKDQQRKHGDLSLRAFDDYFKACERIADFLGKGRALATIDAPDFKRFRDSFPETWGPTTVNNNIARVSAVFNFAYDFGGVDKPIRTGPNFKRISKKKQRLHRAKQNKKEFTAKEIHQLIAAADVHMKAMILLGLNCGYGNADVGRLEIPEIDFKRGWIEGLREKTAIQRAAWLWPETVAALKDAIANKYDNVPSSLADRVFVTKRRQSWFKEEGGADPLSAAFSKLRVKVFELPVAKKLQKSGIEKEEALNQARARWKGVGFYSLRHVFETVGGNSKDQIATNYVMGHCDDSMAAVYRAGIEPKRIKAVCQHVRKWFKDGDPAKKKTKRSVKKGGVK